MTLDNLNRLASLIKEQRTRVLSQWRKQVRELPSARTLDTPTLNDHMPGLLDELIAALVRNPDLTIPQALAGQVRRRTACNASKMHSTSKKWWRSTTSCAAAFTTLPTKTT